MPGDVPKCDRVTIDVEGPDAARFFILPDLLFEKLREIGGS
jgi:hypothetical protein